MLIWIDGLLAQFDRWSKIAARRLVLLGIYVTMPSLVVLVTVDVILRYVFNAPLEWGRDANGLLLMTVFCALPHAWDRAYHIRMEVFYLRFGEQRRRQVDVVAAVAGIIVFGLMAAQAALFVPFMLQTGETGEDLELELWPWMGFLSVCAAVMVARILANPSGEESGSETGVGL